jgi:hypothetical protein
MAKRVENHSVMVEDADEVFDDLDGYVADRPIGRPPSGDEYWLEGHDAGEFMRCPYRAGTFESRKWTEGHRDQWGR